MRSPNEIQEMIDKLLPSMKSGKIDFMTVADVAFYLREYRDLLKLEQKHEELGDDPGWRAAHPELYGVKGQNWS